MYVPVSAITQFDGPVFTAFDGQARYDCSTLAGLPNSRSRTL
jgi:hypothetical protein